MKQFISSGLIRQRSAPCFHGICTSADANSREGRQLPCTTGDEPDKLELRCLFDGPL